MLDEARSSISLRIHVGRALYETINDGANYQCEEVSLLNLAFLMEIKWQGWNVRNKSKYAN